MVFYNQKRFKEIAERLGSLLDTKVSYPAGFNEADERSGEYSFIITCNLPGAAAECCNKMKSILADCGLDPAYANSCLGAESLHGVMKGVKLNSRIFEDPVQEADFFTSVAQHRDEIVAMLSATDVQADNQLLKKLSAREESRQHAQATLKQRMDVMNLSRKINEILKSDVAKEGGTGNFTQIEIAASSHHAAEGFALLVTEGLGVRPVIAHTVPGKIAVVLDPAAIDHDVLLSFFKLNKQVINTYLNRREPDPRGFS
ncbi:MAG TPA: hypothetical protein VHA06_01690 [Candidatus Angelobacter sp.]|nr:hypothetical protein [Candidatus Angelobacter sp.]